MLQLTFRCLIIFMMAASLLNAAYAEPSSAPIIRHNSIHHPVVGERGMVVTQHYLASKVGADILSRGGNAVDAAVAVGFSLAVVLPQAGNLGGGGFMMLHLASENKTVAIDYREMAPRAAGRQLFLDADGNVDKNKARFSHAAVGVPGTVAGLLHVQRRYGKLSVKQILQPAIELAVKGFVVTRDLSDKLSIYSRLRNNAATRAAYYRKDGSSYRAGEILQQPDLAWSLQQIAHHGARAFYQGDIARRIVEEMEANNGLITLQDLADYKVLEREPVRGKYRGYDIVSMPPPSSGGVHLVQMLNTLEHFPLAEFGYGSATAIHPMVEAMKWAYADRSYYLGDPDYIDVPVVELTSKHYGQQLAGRIDGSKATPSSVIRPGQALRSESTDTTHYSIMDAEGNAVSNTYTLNFSFGSGITVPGTGILLNNEMDDFSAKPGVPNAYGLTGAEANKIEPGKRPLSSMTPSLVFRDGKPFIVTGSPGGSRIITTVLQTIINIIDHDMNVAEAVSAPRFHHQWQPDQLFLEPGFSPDTQALLKARGQTLKATSAMGSAQSIVWQQGLFFGAADPRKPDAKAISP